MLLLYYGINHNIAKNRSEAPLYQEGACEYFIQGAVGMTQCLTSDVLAAKVQDKYQLTPLHLASLYGWVEMVRVLLNCGTTVNAEDNLGRTPLHMVSVARDRSIAQENGVCIAQLLLEHGADVNAQDNNHATPLYFASHHEKPEIASLLSRHGGKVNAKVNQNPTPNQLESKGEDIRDHPASST